MKKLGEFTMVSQPIRLILVDFDFFLRSSSIFHFFEVVFPFFSEVVLQFMLCSSF
jgi:hypothetical protein